MQIFYQVIQKVIKPQLTSTNLGHWIREGHQRWQYFSSPNNIIMHLPNSVPPYKMTPVDVKLKPTIQIISSKPPTLSQPESSFTKSPMDAIKEGPAWTKKLWRTTNWTEKNIQDIIEKANCGNISVVGKGNIRHQWGAYYWGFIEKKSKYSNLYKSRTCRRRSRSYESTSGGRNIRSSITLITSPPFTIHYKSYRRNNNTYR